MAKEQFITKKMIPEWIDIIGQANRIIADYQRQGFTLTLRQLYYQFVARDLLPNEQKQYKRLGNILSEARLAGMVDWDAIEDRTRNVRRPSVWSDPSSIIDAVADQYKEDLWAGQPYRPEVWIEKDALVGVIEPVCERYRVPYFACRGNNSQSEQYAAGKRFEARKRAGQRTVVLHLGDHDPSGVDMTRDNRDRLAMFARHDVEVRRLALNMDQIEQYDPPPNPVKETDSRSGPYIEQFGESSWELDALDPPVIDALITDALDGLIDQDLWDVNKENEETNKALLAKASGNWADVVDFLNGLET